MAGLETEQVEVLIKAIQRHLPSNWVAVALDLRDRRDPLHSHPDGCPMKYKLQNFEKAGPTLKFSMKGKFSCDNAGCHRRWNSAMAMLVVHVQYKHNDRQYLWTACATEQSCSSCDRDVFCRVYKDEAQRIAEWLEDAYVHSSYPHEDRKQRKSNMRQPHNKDRCGACRRGLHNGYGKRRHRLPV